MKTEAIFGSNFPDDISSTYYILKVVISGPVTFPIPQIPIEMETQLKSLNNPGQIT
jgi:hypothetical protein